MILILFYYKFDVSLLLGVHISVYHFIDFRSALLNFLFIVQDYIALFNESSSLIIDF